MVEMSFWNVLYSIYSYGEIARGTDFIE